MKNEFKKQITALANLLGNVQVTPEYIESRAAQLMNEINISAISESEKNKIKEEIDTICKAAREGKVVTPPLLKLIKRCKFVGLASAIVIGGGVGASYIFGLTSANASEDQMDLKEKGSQPKSDDKDNETQEVYGPYLSDMTQNTLASHLLFDINDNEALIEQSAQFIANSRACGLDFASEKWVSKFMDFNYIMGLEEIDPVDYARLKYVNKTTQSIIDNYQECANEMAYDLFTVTSDTLLDYPIADKDSKAILMELQQLVAEYNTYIEAGEKNSAKEVAKELEDYFLDNFVHQDGRVYTRATYELVARFANIVDEILPNGLSKEITNKLSEDLYTCGVKVPVGEKNKSERAQAETSIREMCDDKLDISRDYYYQEWDLSEIEYLTGVQLEEQILERVYELDVEFVANPEKFEQEQRTTIIPIKNSTPSVTLSDEVQVSEQTIEEVGLNPATVTKEQYESAVVKQFEETAQKDFEAAVALHKQGSTDAFNDGYNGNAFNPRQNNEDYLEGYTWANYNEGVNSRPKEESKTEFVDTPDQVVESTSTTTTQGYVEGPSNSNSNSQPAGNTTFEPVSEGTTIIIDTTIVENGFVESPSNSNSSSQSTESTTFEPVSESETIIIDTTIVEDGFVETPSSDVIDESSIEIETYFEPIASNASQISQYKALRNMLDTAIVNPTYYVGDGTFAFGNDEYQVSQKTKC